MCFSKAHKIVPQNEKTKTLLFTNIAKANPIRRTEHLIKNGHKINQGGREG